MTPDPRVIRVSVGGHLPSFQKTSLPFTGPDWRSGTFTLKKLECSKQACAMNTLAWNNNLGLRFYFIGCGTEVMIDRDSWGCQYSAARGEILGFAED